MPRSPVSKHAGTITKSALKDAVALVPASWDQTVSSQIETLNKLVMPNSGAPDDLQAALVAVRHSPGNIYRAIKLVGNALLTDAARIVAQSEQVSLQEKPGP
jgi:hypothetical protein